MESLQGHLVFASPALGDPNFHQSVMLMVRHDENGALALILNRPTEYELREAWEQAMGQPCQIDAILHHGGPCEGPLMVLHTEPDASDIEVMPDVHFTTAQEKVEWLVENNSKPIKFFAGYAGWSPGQLEGELNESAWMTAEATRDLVFESNPRQWIALLKRINPTLGMLASRPDLMPQDPSNN